MATNLYQSNIYGLNNSGSPALRFSDEVTTGDLAAILGADDRGGSQPGENALVIKIIGSGAGRANSWTDANWTTTGTEAVTFGQNGSVGIGTTNPQYKLHVNGSFYAAGSSLLYKENIQDYNTKNLLEKILQLRPVKYNYKEKYKHLGKTLKSDYQIGFIAEEVLEIFPELCIYLKEDGEDVVRNVDYEKLNVILLEVLKQLEKEIISLENNK